jgi:hypothetical protein
MLKAKRLVNRVNDLFAQSVPDLQPKDVQAAREYITAYWKKLERYHPN